MMQVNQRCESWRCARGNHLLRRGCCKPTCLRSAGWCQFHSSKARPATTLDVNQVRAHLSCARLASGGGGAVLAVHGWRGSKCLSARLALRWPDQGRWGAPRRVRPRARCKFCPNTHPSWLAAQQHAHTRSAAVSCQCRPPIDTRCCSCCHDVLAPCEAAALSPHSLRVDRNRWASLHSGVTGECQRGTYAALRLRASPKSEHTATKAHSEHSLSALSLALLLPAPRLSTALAGRQHGALLPRPAFPVSGACFPGSAWSAGGVWRALQYPNAPGELVQLPVVSPALAAAANSKSQPGALSGRPNLFRA
jgi:hypothetical protein